jgi:glycosyltransferase involved in cell wall biosynthesis
MADKRISVVIPTLNEEKYIETTLYHLQKQKPYEIIIADSNSRDRTREIAKEHGCRVVRAGKGCAAGRNAGGHAAKGDIILFIDADSIVYPNMLKIIRRDFTKNNKLAGWTCKIYGFSPSWSEQVLYNASNNLVEFLTKYFKKPHAPGIALCVRKDVFEKTKGFDETLKVMEDHDFAMRVGKYGDFKFSKDTCVFTSTRRMNKWGGWGLIKRYSKIYVKYFMNKENFKNNIKKVQYEPIR